MSREIKSPEQVVMIVKSFDGKHELSFNENSHRYKLDGRSCVGTTTFTKAGYPTSMGLIRWMQDQTAQSLFTALTVPGEDGYYPRQSFWPITDEIRKELFKAAKDSHEDVSREAADIGTITHSYAELHSLGKFTEAATLLDKVSGVAKWPVIKSCVQKYDEWAAQNKGELVLAEGLIASPIHLFCGKFDRLDRVEGKLILRDYKTSKSIYPDQFIQLAAYAIAIKEWLDLTVEGLEVLRFGKEDGEFEPMLITDPKEIQMFKEQALRCLATHHFRKIESDPRFDWKKR